MNTNPTTTAARMGYAVMWLHEDPDEGWITHTLVYRGPGGPEVRTYRKGHLDPRAGDEDTFPRFDDVRSAMEFMTEHPGEKCLIAVPAARLIRSDRYATPV